MENIQAWTDKEIESIKEEISFVNAYYENEEDVEYYIETYLK